MCVFSKLMLDIALFFFKKFNLTIFFFFKVYLTLYLYECLKFGTRLFNLETQLLVNNGVVFFGFM